MIFFQVARVQLKHVDEQLADGQNSPQVFEELKEVLE